MRISPAVSPPSDVLAAAFRRLRRHAPPPARPAPAPEARPRSGAPVFTLEPPRPARPPRPPADPRALAALLADDTAARLDELCYLWAVIRELEPFERPGEPHLRRRAAELLLVAAGGSFELPIEGPLRAVRAFLAAHGMAEAYVERLCDWYLSSKRSSASS